MPHPRASENDGALRTCVMKWEQPTVVVFKKKAEAESNAENAEMNRLKVANRQHQFSQELSIFSIL